MLGMGVRLASALTTGFLVCIVRFVGLKFLFKSSCQHLICIVSDIQSDDPKAPIGLGDIEGQYITTLTTFKMEDDMSMKLVHGNGGGIFSLCVDKTSHPRLARGQRYPMPCLE